VCTDSGGPPEYVLDGETGFVVPRDDPPAMADRFRTLLDHPALREGLGEKARFRAESEHPYTVLVSGFLSAYQQALHGVSELAA
jgi:L-malate glycosyltransferase